MPEHFFTDSDSEYQLISSKEAGLALVKSIPFRIEATMPEWPSILSKAIVEGVTLFTTTSFSIKELTEAAAARMGKVVEVKLTTLR